MKLPPLNAIRAFEAAGRHVSFTRAAEELHVTPGAISRHVKQLEATLGVRLFHRHAQGLSLTEPGRRLLPELGNALERIARATARVRADENELRVISEPTIGIRWLVPRLPGFQRTHPDFRVSVGLFSTGHEEFFDGNYDLGIEQAIMADRRPEALEAVPLRREALTPVCAPALLERGPPLVEPHDVLRHTLIHPSPDYWDWKKWFEAAGLDPSQAERGQVFDTTETAVRATICGLGVTVGDLFLVQDELATGQLARPFELVVSDGTGYYLFCRSGGFDNARLAAFRDWILSEAGGD